MKTRKSAVIKPLLGPSSGQLHDMISSFARARGEIYIYRDSAEIPEVIVSNYPMEWREDRLVGVYDRHVKTSILREDLYGISEEEYRQNLSRSGRRPRSP